MMTANSVFDPAAAGWAASIDSTTTPGKAAITAILPDGWADGPLYLVIKPYQMPFVIRPFDRLACTLDVSEFGQRGYLYITCKTNGGTQKNTPIRTYHTYSKEDE